MSLTVRPLFFGVILIGILSTLVVIQLEYMDVFIKVEKQDLQSNTGRFEDFTNKFFHRLNNKHNISSDSVAVKEHPPLGQEIHVGDKEVLAVHISPGKPSATLGTNIMVEGKTGKDKSLHQTSSKIESENERSKPRLEISKIKSKHEESKPKIEISEIKIKNEQIMPNSSEEEKSPPYDHLKYWNFIVNPHNFTYIINNPDICPQDSDLEYLVYFHTATDHFKYREVLRETWAKPNVFPHRPSRTIFFLGATINSELQTQIEAENAQHHDIVQEDYMDTYKNLTYKSVSAFKWITNFCQRVHLIIKADDDVFINMYRMINTYDTKLVNKTRIMYGFRINDNDMPVDRTKRNKWYVSYQEYGKMYNGYPGYYSGMAYMMSRDLVPELYNASLYTPFFWVDDVYIGMLLRKIRHVTRLTEYKAYSLYSRNACTFESGDNPYNTTLVEVVTDIHTIETCWAGVSALAQSFNRTNNI